ncbi:ATP-binding protein [Streptomyces sp. NPDC058657]|uniref:ATP-binding protein n=1 Tax=unclassified Streptomyces TaxID=2593676 RepID=UPI0036687BD2
MDPMNRGSEEYGQDNNGNHDEREGSRPRDPMTRDLGPSAASAPARTVQLTSGDFLLTVNPVDGSEIEPCPPGERPGAPVRHPAADRAELARAAKPAVPPGPATPELPLLERQEERERLVALVSRGRSVRLVGSAGSGRTALLDAVAADCAGLAPDGVVRLSGYRRTQAELLQDLFAAVFRAPRHRPGPDELRAYVHDIGAVVVLDDLEFGGDALQELLDATPECAFLISVTPEAAALTPSGLLEEVLLGGLGRGSSLELLERAVQRPLTDEEANWAGDLWFESEGLPLRFVQAGALLRQRDVLRADPGAFDEYGYFTEAPLDAPFDAEDGHDVPLSTLAEGMAPVAPLAARLSESARATLRFAVALGGEVPHQAHLPALVGDTHADAALGELLECGLLSRSGARHRLAAGAEIQLLDAGYGEDATEHALTAAQHYAWWAGHPSVTPERISAESDAVLAALAALVPGTEVEHPSAAVLLARTAAPAFAAGLQWGAWERSLRTGAEASRLAGEVGEEAYFHHELGVLALCGGRLDRARAELETSVGLRGALADKRGTVAARRALALVTDRSGGAPGPVLAGRGFGAGAHAAAVPRSPFDTPYDPFTERSSAGEEIPAAGYEESASPPAGVPAGMGALSLSGAPDSDEPLVTRSAGGAEGPPSRRSMLHGARRNLVAAGAGALLVAVLGTVVTLGATGNKVGDDGGRTPEQSANQDTGKGGLDADRAEGSEGNGSGGGSSSVDDGSAGRGVPAADSTSRDRGPGSPDPTSTTGPGAGKPTDGAGEPTKPPTTPGRPTDPPTRPTVPPTKPTVPPTKPTDPPTTPTVPPTTPKPDPTTPKPDPPTSPGNPPATSPDNPPTSPVDDQPPTSPGTAVSAAGPTVARIG